ncbi:MAG: phosphate transport system permease protein [Thermoproteota archaeon]|nr:phosphate transport system permease protein [Thermoproteota archaeon]
MNRKAMKQLVYFQIFRITTISIVLFLFYMLWTFVLNGLGVVNWTFLTDIPRNGMTAGGIFPAIIGTIYLTLMTIIFTVPVGVASAIYLVEYAHEGRFVDIINSAITNLAGVPSIIHGLFGFGLFVVLLNFGTSLLSGALALSLLDLPIVISASREALLSVPKSFREGSLALGATKWETIRHNVLIYALPGILTGTILAVARAAGETAPIILTATFFYRPNLPTSLLDGTMSLPTHIYYMATQHYNIALVQPLTYGAALVLLLIVILMNIVAIVIRSRYRKMKKW